MAGIVEYIIISGISLTVLYLFFAVFLKKETFFRLNRFYLLAVMALTTIMPLLEFSYPADIAYNQNEFVYLEHEIETVSSYVVMNTYQEDKAYSIIYFVCLIYLAGVFYYLLKYVINILKILKTIKQNEVIKEEKYNYVIMNEHVQAFSFLRYIFISQKEYDQRSASSIVLHEQEHVKQMHTLDLFILELLVVIQWFNPFIHLFRRSVREVHEYLADNAVIRSGVEPYSYMHNMISCTGRNVFMSLSSSFNYLLTKKRLKMITKNNSKKLAMIKAGLVIPVIGLMLMIFAFQPVEVHNFNIALSGEALLKPDSGRNVPSIFPVEKDDYVAVSSGYGKAINPITKKERFHKAVDIKAKEGMKVYATADGVVKKAEYGDAYGNFIIIDHSKEYSSLYAHMSKLNVKKGDKVKKGDVIGYIGSTGMSAGSHLHYEIKKNGQNVNPSNYLGQ